MKNIRVYNTITRRKHYFKPLNDREVSFYVCGPTVYDYFHIGNARIFIVFDVIRRYLEYRGYKVTFVQNFTDIDDKIIKKAHDTGTGVMDVAEKYIEAYFRDAAALKIRQAQIHPRATEHISSIVELIRKLFEKGLAYQVDGDILFDTEKYPGYGKLSQQKREDLLAGSRVKVDEKKNNPLDFVLWKASKPGEPSWESPWGNGRPGWHIECSAMAASYLGETIDFHAGGPDLIFPHHENEIAQSEGATGKPFVNHWLHAGFLNIDSEKMSKSLGNVLNIRELIDKYNPFDLRFFMLSSHYRNPLNFSEELLVSASSGRKRLQEMFDNLISGLNRAGDYPYGSPENQLNEQLRTARKKFTEVMDDDFNTAEAMGVIFSLARDVNIYLAGENINADLLGSVKTFMLEVNNILDVIDCREEVCLEERVQELISRREEARSKKDWATADRIRDDLGKEGIILEDTPQGVRWKLADK